MVFSLMSSTWPPRFPPRSRGKRGRLCKHYSLDDFKSPNECFSFQKKIHTTVHFRKESREERTETKTETSNSSPRLRDRLIINLSRSFGDEKKHEKNLFSLLSLLCSKKMYRSMINCIICFLLTAVGDLTAIPIVIGSSDR